MIFPLVVEFVAMCVSILGVYITLTLDDPPRLLTLPITLGYVFLTFAFMWQVWKRILFLRGGR